MTISSKRQSVVILTAIVVLQALVPALADERIDEIIVTADYRERAADELPAAISVLDAETIESAAAQHFEELLNIIPNLNWSGDGHRARYFQVRGVGELEQYQGAPNPSIGFLIDDIDFSGIGTIATLFDVERVEVLRGPQGMRYGANALGGLIYMRSRMPTVERNGRLQLGAADDNSFSVAGATGGALNEAETALFRLSASHHESDGFRRNPYLGRTDTNGRNETSLRARLSWYATDDMEVNVAAVFADIDNGYDAFALDNSFTVLSDKPGRDSQRSAGLSFKLDWNLPGGRSLTALSSLARSDIEFSFDADWGNDDSWAPFVYDFVSINDRERRTLSQEFRLASGPGGALDWLVGVYALRLEDRLQSLNSGDYDDGAFAFSLTDPFDSEYSATNVAAFGQVIREIAPGTELSFGLRVERRATDYSDTAGLNEGPSENMLGGEITLTGEATDSVTTYVSLSRGYKAGGFNLGPGLDQLQLREFGSESMWNIEAGLKSSWFDDSLVVNTAVFYSERVDQQMRLSFQLNPNDPASFGFATVNADGRSNGFEADVRWFPSDAWEFYASIGLLDTSIDDVAFPGAGLASGREQAHAPRYTFASGAAWSHPSGWFLGIDVAGKDEFFFDVSHDQRSQAYELVNVRFGFDYGKWSATLWARNLFDERYAVRGFFFGNEPPNFTPTLYTKPGDPRQVGVTFKMRFGS